MLRDRWRAASVVGGQGLPAIPKPVRLTALLTTVLLTGVLLSTSSTRNQQLHGGDPASNTANAGSSRTGGGAAGATGRGGSAGTAGTGGSTGTRPATPDGGAATSPGSAPATSTGSLASYLARLPRFPAPPAPQPVTLPDGPAAAWYGRIPTSAPVAFLTIDDGWVKHPDAAPLIAAARVPVTLFLSVNAVHDDPGYFRRLQDAGAVIEAHTLTHPSLRGQPYPAQRHEICGSADQLATWYGRRPTLFRPPFGNKDATTLQATRDCGLHAAFFWTETVDKGIVRFQTGHTVKPGDIILMHFRPAFPDDFLAALTAIHDAGLTPALLEDWVRAPAADSRHATDPTSIRD